ncbi:glutamate receptor-like [Liolophura sinensis]|uniref:glutamate receptor-like n=1 Tax=Liolophura sinensis TaxID=3198878 RepID=UPI00315895EA
MPVNNLAAVFLHYWVASHVFIGISSLRKIPIGSIFDTESREIEAAFRYAVIRFNKVDNDMFELDHIGDSVKVSDSFELSTAICSQLSKGVATIFGISNTSTSPTLHSYCDEFDMPFITTSLARNVTTPSSMVLHMRPIYARAILDVMRDMKWQIIQYVYDSEEGLIRLQQLFQELNSAEYRDLDVDVKKVTSAESVFASLKQIDLEDEKDHVNILLDLPIEKTEKLLHLMGNDQSINRGSFNFFIGGLGLLELNLTRYQNGGLNIIGYQMVDFSNLHVKVFLQHWEQFDPRNWPGAGSQKITYEAALAIDAVHLFTKTMHPILKMDGRMFRENTRYSLTNSGRNMGTKCMAHPVMPFGQGIHLKQAMREAKFEGLTGTVSFDEYGYRKNISLTLMELTMNRGMAKIGQWRGKLEKLKPQIWRQEKNDTRIQRITTILTEPYAMEHKAPFKDGKVPTGNDRYYGFCITLAEKVAKIVHMDYIIQVVKDGKYGKLLSNDTWNGMVGELIRHEADIVIAPLTITAIRETYIDFTKPFMSLGISIMVKRPEDQEPNVFSFMDPLSYEIWMCIIFAYIGVSVVLFLVSRFSPYEWHVDDESGISNDFTISNSLWFSLGAFMQQGCEISPRSISGRIVGSVWWFFTLIVISSYTANLAAFLTVERMSSPIESAEDLAKQTEIQYGIVKSGSTYDFFRHSKIALYQKMFAYMTSQNPSVFVSSEAEGVQKVKDSEGKYAFLLESTTNDYYNQRQPCDTIKVGSNLDSKGFGIATPIGSEMRDHLTLAVLELRENGELRRMTDYWWKEKGECKMFDTTLKRDSGQNSLTLGNVAGIFYILIGGLILAVFMVLTELLYKSKIDSKRMKTTFASALRSKTRLSFRGKQESETPHQHQSYSYTAPSQVISLDGYATENTHTQV